MVPNAEPTVYPGAPRGLTMRFSSAKEHGMADRTKPRTRSAKVSSPKGRRSSPEPRLATMGAEVQRFGTLRLLPIALEAEAHRDSCQGAFAADAR